MGAAPTVAPSGKHPSPRHDRPVPPLIKDNTAAAAARRSGSISSRYLSYTSANHSAASTRHPSPLLSSRASTLPSPSAAAPRSLSAGRSRPDPTPAPPRTVSTTTTTTRCLSVSFQGDSFFYQTSKAKPAPDRRPLASTPTRPSKPSSDDTRPFERWPAARPRHSDPLPSCSPDKKEPVLATVRLVHQTLRHASFDTADLSASSDTDSASSGSNSGSPELNLHPPRQRPAPHGICIPVRFWQEQGTLRPAAAQPKLASVKKSFVESPESSPRSVCSSVNRGPARGCSPSKLADSRVRGIASPLRARSGGAGNAATVGQPGNAPSIISFAAEVRRAKKGENRIEEAHMLRLMHNRQLQWRFVNARAVAALMTQRLLVEKDLYNAWITTSRMCDSVTIKKIKLQLLTQHLKLTTLLKGQMNYLEEWSLMETEHSSSLLGSNEALQASTLRVPVVGGARANLQEVKDAVGSAVDVMQAMGSSICSLLSKVEGTGSTVPELAKVTAQERNLLDRSRELLSKVAAMHVTQCSLRGHILQLKCGPNQMQL